jgi:kynurenine formamidase
VAKHEEEMMRIPADVRLEPWEPPTYRVDANGKVVGAVPGTPNNWGRWGDLDQLGTLNLLTPERATAAAGLVQEGRTFALGMPVGHGAPYPGSRSEPLHGFFSTTTDFIVGDRGRYAMQASDDFVVTGLQTLTQLDGLAHVAVDDVLYNGYWAGLVTAASGARRLGIHHLAGGIVGRGVLLDVAAYQGGPCDGAINRGTLDAVAAHQSVEMLPGDILLLRTGFLGHWLEAQDPEVRRQPVGVDESTVSWMAENDVAMLAVDNAGVEFIQGLPHHPDLPFHRRAIKDLGLLLGEFFDLDELAAHCQSIARYVFLFVAQPLPFMNAVGSPLNPTALL